MRWIGTFKHKLALIFVCASPANCLAIYEIQKQRTSIMKKSISLGLLVAGLLLLYFGYHEYHSFQSEVNQFFGGSGSDKAIWMLVGGAAASIAGFAGLLRSRNS
jgi:hypothetical protein